MVDGDTLFEPDTLRRLVQPLQRLRGRRPSPATPRSATAAGCSDAGSTSSTSSASTSTAACTTCSSARPTVPGAIGAFRRDVLEQVGGVARRHARGGHRPDARDRPDRPPSRLRRGRPRVDRGAVEPRRALATALPLVVRHDAGGLQAPGAIVTRDPRRATDRPARAALHDAVPDRCYRSRARSIDLFALYGRDLRRRDPASSRSGPRFNLLQLALAVYAFRLDRESLRPLWALPLQQFVYRQLMYLVIIESTVSALVGARAHWRHLTRTGEVDVKPVG